MGALEPGQKFTVSFGNDRTCEVVSLSLRDQKRLARIIREVVEAEGKGTAALDVFELSEQGLRIAMPDADDSFLDTIDAEDANEITMKCLGKQSLNGEEKKS